jgi:predicted RND superfamily exporter protein
MKKFGKFITTVGVIWIIILSITGIFGKYDYENDYLSYWHLADKSSTIPKKAEYIDKFVTVLEKSNMEGEYNALILKTPNNSFDSNMEALKSLQSRLQEVQGMDVTSFQYQTAIQQITEQEQGEAGDMLKVFHGIWWKTHHFLLWDWVGFINWALSGIMCISGLLITFKDDL